MVTLLLLAALHHQITVVDTVHTRLSRIVSETIASELNARNNVVGEGGEYVAEVVDVSDSGGKARTSQVALPTTRRAEVVAPPEAGGRVRTSQFFVTADDCVEITEITGGATAEIRLYDAAHVLIATYKLTGSGRDGAGVGSNYRDPLSAFIAGPLLRRTRSADAARGIGHDVAVRILETINAPSAAPDTPQR